MCKNIFCMYGTKTHTQTNDSLLLIPQLMMVLVKVNPAPCMRSKPARINSLTPNMMHVCTYVCVCAVNISVAHCVYVHAH
ncbi:hypothetical protein EON63_24955 [archaeon]|nr:MAG: hypothetical protein EON63_24955 [archaeon]